MSKNILITGGAGFIGSHLVDLLLKENFNIIVVDNFDPFYDENIKRKNIAAHLNKKNFTLIEGDIRDYDFLIKSLPPGIDIIVHLAAKAGVRPSIVYPLEYADVNVRGTQNLLEIARMWNVEQFVFASSSSVYGINSNVPWGETDYILKPISPYASTKVCAELLGHVYSHLYGIRFIALRFFTVFGPRQRPDLAIHKFSRMILNQQKIPMFGDGSTRRDYTYVGDIVKAVRDAMHYKSSLYEIINVGNHTTISLKEMIETLEKVFEMKAIIEKLEEQPGDVPQTYADVNKARDLLGYQPSTKFEDGIKLFKEWLCTEIKVDEF